MKEKILTFYNNNKRKILLILIVIVILIALPRVLQFFTKGTENEPINLNEKKWQNENIAFMGIFHYNKEVKKEEWKRWH